MKTRAAHIRDIRAGDTVIHNGEVKTVSVNNLKRDPCVGVTLFGDSYNLGYKPVIKVDPSSI